MSLLSLVWCLLTAISYAATLSKPAWCDEVLYIDAGANLALGKGFVSTSWVTMCSGSAWGSSTPFTPLFFAGIFKLFGFGLIQARTAFFVVHFFGALLVSHWVSQKYKLRPVGMLGTYAALMFFEPIAHVLYNPRHDTFALLLCAWFLYVVLPVREMDKPRLLSAACLGFVSPLVGLHFAAYFTFAMLITFLVMRSRRLFNVGASMAIGMVCSVVALKAGYSLFGVWDQFLAARGLHYGRQLPWVPTGLAKFTLSREIVLLACLLFALGAWKLFRRTSIINLAPVFFGLACFVLIPILIGAVGIYYSNYAWMVALPMAISVVAIASGSLTLSSRWPLIITLLGSFWALGYQVRPLRAFWVMHRQVAAGSEVAAKIANGAPVSADFPCYYELKARGVDAHFAADPARGNRIGVPRDLYMPSRVADAIAIAVADATAIEGIKTGLGGEWVEVGESLDLVRFKVYQKRPR